MRRWGNVLKRTLAEGHLQNPFQLIGMAIFPIERVRPFRFRQIDKQNPCSVYHMIELPGFCPAVSAYFFWILGCVFRSVLFQSILGVGGDILLRTNGIPSDRFSNRFFDRKTRMVRSQNRRFRRFSSIFAIFASIAPK